MAILHPQTGHQVASDGVARSREPTYTTCVGSYPTKDAHQRTPADSGIRT